MNTLSDIEEVSGIDDSFRNGNTQHTSYTINSEDRTSKSTSVMFAVDPSVLHLISANEDDDDSDYSDDRRRDPLLGPCCDLVRAVIYIDIFYILKNINVIITICVGWSVVDPDDYNLRQYSDDEMEATVDRLDLVFWILMIKNICGIVFASIGIYGSSRFNKWLVLCTTIFCCIDVLWSIMFARWIATVLTIFFIYPHVALFLALHKGKITRENYADVKHCCFACCIKEKNSSPESESNAQESRQSTGTSTEKSAAESSASKDTQDPPRQRKLMGDDISSSDAQKSIAARSA